ncbi:uncharacterized protein ARMOST_14272 [Armillaria ostoyae]|uniref:Uncharacterized protein n=1 Tax=Armillaria ostoyae TaxID=47428 RepID=A0A284RQ29_ARMOS|nr:uncharacterized protein ARMOST_14272 [Armillaria ostoyae]
MRDVCFVEPSFREELRGTGKKFSESCHTTVSVQTNVEGERAFSLRKPHDEKKGEGAGLGDRAQSRDSKAQRPYNVDVPFYSSAEYE